MIATRGAFKSFDVLSDSGGSGKIKFCPTSGTTVLWNSDAYLGNTGISVGCFGDPHFPAPVASIWNSSKHQWLRFADDVPCLDTQLPRDLDA
jgi:hypothetical protein